MKLLALLPFVGFEAGLLGVPLWGCLVAALAVTAGFVLGYSAGRDGA